MEIDIMNKDYVVSPYQCQQMSGMPPFVNFIDPRNMDAAIKLIKDILKAMNINDFVFRIDCDYSQRSKLINAISQYNSKSAMQFCICAYPLCQNNKQNACFDIVIFDVISVFNSNRANIMEFLCSLYSLDIHNFRIIQLENVANMNNHTKSKSNPKQSKNNKEKIFAFKISVTTENFCSMITFINYFSDKFKNSIYQIITDNDGHYTYYCKYNEDIVNSVNDLSRSIHEKIQTEVI